MNICRIWARTRLALVSWPLAIRLLEELLDLRWRDISKLQCTQARLDMLGPKPFLARNSGGTFAFAAGLPFATLRCVKIGEAQIIEGLDGPGPSLADLSTLGPRRVNAVARLKSSLDAPLSGFGERNVRVEAEPETALFAIFIPVTNDPRLPAGLADPEDKAGSERVVVEDISASSRRSRDGSDISVCQANLRHEVSVPDLRVPQKHFGAQLGHK